MTTLLHYLCYRLVLAACSDYFAAMFTNGLLEAEQQEVVMRDINGDALETLVSYMYTGRPPTVCYSRRVCCLQISICQI